MSKQSDERRTKLGPIDDGTSYPLAIFMGRVGMTRSSLREARRSGLSVRKVGTRCFALGRHWNKFLEEKAEVV